MRDFVLFCLATIGMTQIIIYGSILESARQWLKAKLPAKIYAVFECHLCLGTWCGFIMSAFLLDYKNPFIIFAGGMAGAYLSFMGEWFSQYLQARTVVDIDFSVKKEDDVQNTL